MRSDAGKEMLPLLGAAGVGAAVMYFLDPARGARRRNLVRDQVVHAGHVLGDVADMTQRDLRQHLRGVASTASRPFTADDADDRVITERVRAELGRLVSHPSAIEATAEGGRVTLAGPVLAPEADRLVAGVRSVRGVTEVEDRLDRHDSPEGVPGLQGAARRPSSRLGILQDNWTPTTRLLTGAAGGALTLYALGEPRRRTPMGALAGLAGLSLLGRSVANKRIQELVGVGAGRRAVQIQKTINIAAPVDEVSAWFTDWERWPQWMSHVRRVTSAGPRGAEGERTHWEVEGPAGSSLAWDSITTRLDPERLVSWKSVEGSAIEHAGILKFARNADGSTRVQIEMSYNPIAGAAGHAVAALLGSDPKRQMDDDLARLKTTIESGVAPHDAAALESRSG